jgi:PAS domain S-box-containing protein
MPTAAIRQLLSAWRAADRAWERSDPAGAGYRRASIDVLEAWLAYQAATEVFEPGTFALVVDDEQVYVAVSEGVTAVLGYEPIELVGRRIEDIAAPDLAAATPAQWSAFIAAGRQDGHFRLLAKGGSIVALTFHARAHHPIPGFHVSRLALDPDGS